MATALLRFRLAVDVRRLGDGTLHLDAPGHSLALGRADAGAQDAFRRLARRGATADQLAAIVLDSGGASALAWFRHAIELCSSRGMLCWHLLSGPRRTVAQAVVMAGSAKLDTIEPTDGARFRLTPFTTCRRDGDRLVVEAPMATMRLLLSASAAARLWAELATPRSVRQLSSASTLDIDTVCLLLGAMQAAGFLECTPPTAAPWEFHDLLFHGRSRRGTHDHAYGGTYPGRGMGAAHPPVHRGPDSVAEIPLACGGTLGAAALASATFTETLARRRSLRAHGDDPIALQELGVFLDATLRRRAHASPSGLPRRSPYPTAGGLQGLEAYVIVDRCAGLDRGLYHYRASAHTLGRMAHADEALDILLSGARSAAGLSQPPQLLIVMTACMSRLGWKYSSIAYALALKEFGAAAQTMYLVATAMNVAPCMLGGGDSSAFARASGVSALDEPSIGEFMLGSIPAAEHPRSAKTAPRHPDA